TAPPPVADPPRPAPRWAAGGVRPVPLRRRAGRPSARTGPRGGVAGTLRGDQPIRTGTRRQRYDAGEGRAVRLPGRTEGQAAATPAATGQVLEVQPRRYRRTRLLARLPAGLPGDTGPHRHRVRALVRGPGRCEMVRPAGCHR